MTCCTHQCTVSWQSWYISRRREYRSKNTDRQILWISLHARLTGCPGSHCLGVGWCRVSVMRKVKSVRGFTWIQNDKLTLKACFITRLCMPTFTSTTTALCTPSGETSMLAMSIPLSSCTLPELKLQCQVTSTAANSCNLMHKLKISAEFHAPWWNSGRVGSSSKNEWIHHGSPALPPRKNLKLPTPEIHLPNPAKPSSSQFLLRGKFHVFFLNVFFSQFHRIAMSLWMIAVYMTAFSVGMHAACLAGHLTLMMTGASLNHAGFDLEIRFLGAKLVVSQNWSWLCLGFKAYYCILLLYIQWYPVFEKHDKPVVST